MYLYTMLMPMKYQVTVTIIFHLAAISLRFRTNVKKFHSMYEELFF